MKKFSCLALAIALCFCAIPSSQAADRYEMGAVAVKVDYFHFFDSNIKNLDAQDGVYVGLEFYKQLFFPNFFLGIEAGWAGPSGTLSGTPFGIAASLETETTYIPIELNMKYVIPLTPCFTFDLGGGISANYLKTELEFKALGTSFNASDNHWLFGGQFFAELNYKYQNWVFGLDAKYQLTTEETFNYSVGGTPIAALPIAGDNVRAGGHIRYMF